MFHSLTDLENQQFLPTITHPSSEKYAKTSPFSTFKEKCNSSPKPLKWMLISAFTLAFLYTFWHTQTPSYAHSKLTTQHYQFDEKLTEILTHISKQIHASQISLSTAQLAARYGEGFAEGLTQRPNKTVPQFQPQPQQYMSDIAHPQTLRTLLDAIKTQVLHTTSQTLQTLTHALSNPHLHTTKSDKHLTAEKLVEVAVAFELSAARLIAESRILTGRKDTEDLERERIVEDLGIDSQDEMTPEQEVIVKEFFPVSDKLAKALSN